MYGIKEGRIGYETIGNKYVPSKKKIIIILSHNLGGGVSKYVNDLLTNIEIVCHKYFEYEIITNESLEGKNSLKSNIKYVHGKRILEFLESNIESSYEIILHINEFTERFSKYSIESIKSILLSFKKNVRRKIIITVHDYYWMLPANPNATIVFFKNNLHVNYSFMDIFQLADLVIFPTRSVYGFYKSKKEFTNIKYEICGHPDISYYVENNNDIFNNNEIKPYFNKINKEIRVLYIGSLCHHKGYNSILDMISILNSHDEIIFHFCGNGTQLNPSISNKCKIKYHGKYQDENILTLINQIQPHLILLSSIFYETWSYVCSLVLKTGLPIFYNQEVYYERLTSRLNTNIYSYESSSSIEEISIKFLNCIESLKSKESTLYRNICNINIIKFPPFYEDIYGTYGTYDHALT
jgi:glycosyltransferase involved in cell wall biosynthesis